MAERGMEGKGAGKCGTESWRRVKSQARGVKGEWGSQRGVKGGNKGDRREDQGGRCGLAAASPRPAPALSGPALTEIQTAGGCNPDTRIRGAEEIG